MFDIPMMSLGEAVFSLWTESHLPRIPAAIPLGRCESEEPLMTSGQNTDYIAS